MKNLPIGLFFSLLAWSCSAPRQNVVFVLVDDLGWKDLGYMGSTFHETPNIDSLSEASVRFTDAYSSGSVCSPSRAAIMTGKHPARVNITDWIPGLDPKKERLTGPIDLNELPLEEVTLAEALQAEGYLTFFAGKWHLGGQGFFPDDQGFQTNVAGHHVGQPPGGYYSPYNNPVLSDGPEGEYLTDRLTDEAIEFLDTVNDDPFFLFLTYYSVHTPIQASKRHVEHFERKLEAMGKPEAELRIEGKGKTTLHQRNAAYASMVYAMDENVGRLIAELKRKGLYENTLIIFTSDNGGLSTVKSVYKNAAPTSVLPLRGGKGWLYEGGIRVPLLIKPAGSKGAGKTNHVPVIGHDFFPTVLSQLGIESGGMLDGKDLSPLLHDEGRIARDSIYWHFPHYHGSAWTPGAAIRQGDWKLIEFHETGRVELYNLAEDISEAVDLSARHPEKVECLRRLLHEKQRSMGANSATINQAWNDLPGAI